MQATSNFINLQSLLDLSGRLNETLEEKNIYKISLLTLLGKLAIVKYLIISYDSTNGYKVFDKKGNIDQYSADLISNSIVDCTDSKDCLELVNRITQNNFEYCLKLHYDKIEFGMIFLGKKLNGNSFNDEEKQYCEIVAKILVNSLQNARNYSHILKEKQKLNYRNQMLKTLNEVSTAFGSKFNEKQILQYYSLTLMGNLLINKFAILFQFSNEKDFKELINKFESSINLNIDELNTQPAGESGDNSSKLKNISIQPKEAKFILKINQNNKLKALLILPERKNGIYDEELIDFIEALTNTLILALENARLFQSEIEKRSIENELGLALKIQQNLLPKEFPDIGKYSYFGTSLPSKHVGGDYFDIIKLPDNKLLITIADVSGKGVPASLVMANLQAALHVLSNINFDLKEAIYILNNLIYENTSFDRFVTFFCGELDLKTNILKYINCGHNPPILIKKDRSNIELKTGGILLGVFENCTDWKQGQIEMDSEDLLLLYTDGVIEAQNKTEQEYGLNKLIEFLDSNHTFSPKEVCNNLITEIENYSENCLQYDDITLLAIKRK